MPYFNFTTNVSNTTLYGKKKKEYKEFKNGTQILLRCERGNLNRVCTIIRKTDKAVLFKTDNEIEDDLTHEWVFWIPKSAIFMLEDELQVYYLKSWVTIKNIASNKPIPQC